MTSKPQSCLSHGEVCFCVYVTCVITAPILHKSQKASIPSQDMFMRFWDILNRTGNRQRRTEDGGRWARGKSSFWSGLFVAEMPPGPLSSSGAAWHRADDPTHHWRAVGCKMPFGAAPKGAWPSLQGGRYYKHGAPNGAEPISVVEDTYKVQASMAPSPRGRAG